jgi:uncharacterized membrane protein
MVKLFLMILLIINFTACTKNNPNNKKVININNEPKWMTDPVKEANGKITAIGCSARHYKGIQAQKKLALQRAIDEIAMQINTKVSKISLNRRSNISSSTSSTSLQEVNEENVSIKVMKYYITKNGDICVWIIKN